MLLTISCGILKELLPDPEFMTASPWWECRFSARRA